MINTSSADVLRNAMVDELIAQRYVRSPAVEEAMRSVPRHLYAPWLSPEDAYRNEAWTIPDTRPEAPATISQPAAVALMLEGFDLQPGFRVLEIGAGTGYNAALIAHIVGTPGLVVTVDIEASLVEAATTRLAPLLNVRVVHGDGADGFLPAAPYDRIVATVGAWDLPPAWAAQLDPQQGRLVVPLHLSGPPEDHVLVSFRPEGDALVGTSLGAFQMVLMRGPHGHRGDEVPERRGLSWRGASSDDLQVTASPHGVSQEMNPYEMVIEKPSVRLVLARRTPRQALQHVVIGESGDE